MSQRPTEFLSAVLLVSRDPARLARFYREVIGVELKEEEHDETQPHYGGQLGDLHFAIHPLENFAGIESEGSESEPQTGSVKLAFEIFDMEEFLTRLRMHGVEPLYPPKPLGTSVITAVRDPDGNVIEFTQLSAGWYTYLQERREKGYDILQRWKQIQQEKRE